MSSRRKPAGQRSSKAKGKKETLRDANEPAAADPYKSAGEDANIPELKNFVAEQLKRLRKDMDLNHAALAKDLETASTKLRKRAKVDKSNMQATVTQIEDHFRQYANDSAEDIQEVKTASDTLLLKCRPGVTLTTKLLPDLLRTFEANLESLRTKYDPSM